MHGTAKVQTMIEAFFLAPASILFTIAITFFLVLFLLEIFATLLGSSLSHIDIDLDFDFNTDTSIFDTAMLWMNPKNLPLSMLFPIFLLAFGLLGYGSLYLLLAKLGIFLTSGIAITIHYLTILVAAIFGSRFISGIVSSILPKDETYAVSTDSFLERTAVLTTIDATSTDPAEARLVDTHGQTHYVLVQPLHEEDVLKVGTTVKLVSKRDNVSFNAVKL